MGDLALLGFFSLAFFSAFWAAFSSLRFSLEAE
jgi:hypothetical protein